MAISDKHRAFVEEYLQCWSAAEAYRRVYPKASKHSAWTLGSNLLRKVEVRAAIEARLREKRMSADEVLGRLSAQAKASLEPFIVVGKDGSVSFDFGSEQARMHLAMIKRMKVKADETVDVEVVDSQSALEKLGKHYKLFNDRMEVVHTLNVEGYEKMLDRIYGRDKDEGE